jgi:hypothetical protein
LGSHSKIGFEPNFSVGSVLYEESLLERNQLRRREQCGLRHEIHYKVEDQVQVCREQGLQAEEEKKAAEG